jgi:hypothetical protein
VPVTMLREFCIIANGNGALGGVVEAVALSDLRIADHEVLRAVSIELGAPLFGDLDKC